MLYTGGETYEVPSYKNYRNQTRTKHLNKISNQLSQIRQCSLKASDKKALLKQILDEVTHAISRTDL